MATRRLGKSRPDLGPIPVDAWERALLMFQHMNEMPSCEDLVVAAAANSNMGAEDILAAEDADSLVDQLLESFKLAAVSIAFPESTLGDAIWVTVSCLPGGTIVGVREPPRQWKRKWFVLPAATLHELEVAALSLLDDAQDGADWAVYEDGADIPEDGIPARHSGLSELKKAWRKRARRRNGETKASSEPGKGRLECRSTE